MTHSFPTRRSSDLQVGERREIDPGGDRIDIKVTRDRHHVHGGEFAQYRLLSERRGEGPLSFWRRLRPVVYLKAAIGEDDAPSGPPDTRQTAATRRLPFVERESEVEPPGAMPVPHRGGRQPIAERTKEAESPRHHHPPPLSRASQPVRAPPRE